MLAMSEAVAAMHATGTSPEMVHLWEVTVQCKCTWYYNCDVVHTQLKYIALSAVSVPSSAIALRPFIASLTDVFEYFSLLTTVIVICHLLHKFVNGFNFPSFAASDEFHS